MTRCRSYPSTLFGALPALCSAVLAANPVPPAPAEPEGYRPAIQAFAAEIATRHGFAATEVQSLLDQASYRQPIIDLMERPYEGKPWPRYRQLFLTPDRIARGAEFWRAHEALLARAASVYGVRPAVIVAIVGIETNYGRQVGSHRVLDALTTLGFAYPPRAAFFRGELEQFLLLSREERVDPLTAVGSYAGALGQPQFIASSYRAYAVDFDGDGRRDLWSSPADVIGSVANYFHHHGWHAGEPVAVPAQLLAPLTADIMVADNRPLAPNITLGQLRVAGVDWRPPLNPLVPATLIRLDGSEPESAGEYWVGLPNFYVITRYNHSNLYAMAVHQLSEAIQAHLDATKAADSAAPDPGAS